MSHADSSSDAIRTLFHWGNWRPLVGGALLLAACLPRMYVAIAGLLLLALPVVRTLMKANKVAIPALLQHPDDTFVAERGRVSAKMEGGFVVFLIGARNSEFPLHLNDMKWSGEAMDGMLKELRGSDAASTGFLGGTKFLSDDYGSPHMLAVQYWKTPQHLVEYARSQTHTHSSAWKRLFEIGKKNPAMGFFHETYVVPAGTPYETIYVNMPPTLLGAATGATLLPCVGSMNTSYTRMAENGKGNLTVAEPPSGCPMAWPKDLEGEHY